MFGQRLTYLQKFPDWKLCDQIWDVEDNCNGR